MGEIIGIIFLTFVGLLVLAYVWVIILTLIQVDWRNRWKIYIKETVIVYIALCILVAALNPTSIELQETVGWARQFFEQTISVGTIAFLMALPFINLRNAK